MTNDNTCVCNVWKVYTISLMQYKEDVNVNDDRYKLCKSNIDNMNWNDVIKHEDIIYEIKKRECGIIMRFRGCENSVDYIVK